MKSQFFLLLIVFLLPTLVNAAGDGRVVLIKGSAKTDKEKKIALNDVIPMGATVITEGRSIVKLLFPDNTQMTIGPNSSVRLEVTAANQAGVVHMIGGQIRSKVYKDVKQNSSPEGENKLIIKTNSAAMGIRGTDFMTTYNSLNDVTTLLVFDGVVTMAKVNPSDTIDAALRDSSRAQPVLGGNFSSATPQANYASPPIKISVSQLEALKANENFDPPKQNSTSIAPSASPIAPGLDPTKASLSYLSTGEQRTFSPSEIAPPPSDGGALPGGFLDPDTGLYVPPPPGSTFDPKSGVFVPPSTFGTIDPNTGSYLPPAGLTLDPVKGFVATENKGNATGAAASPATMAQFAAVLNQSMQTSLSGGGSTFDKTFAPTAAGPGTFVPTETRLPPPLPDNRTMHQMPPPEPESEQFCPTCISDNVTTIPPQTSTKFRFNF